MSWAAFYGTMPKEVNEVFAIVSQSFARGTSLQSYNKFVGLCSGVNFIIPYNTLVLCWDSFVMRASRSALQINGKLLYIASNSQGYEVEIKMLAPYQLTFSHINHTASTMRTL